VDWLTFRGSRPLEVKIPSLNILQSEQSTGKISDSAARPCHIVVIISCLYSHPPGPSTRTTPHLYKGVPRMIAFHADPWLAVRLHPKHCLLGTGKLISKAKSNECIDAGFQTVQSRSLRAFFTPFSLSGRIATFTDEFFPSAVHNPRSCQQKCY
jgi:hypothetical protein